MKKYYGIPKYLNCSVCGLAIFILKDLKIVHLLLLYGLPDKVYCYKCGQKQEELTLHDHRI